MMGYGVFFWLPSFFVPAILSPTLTVSFVVLLVPAAQGLAWLRPAPAYLIRHTPLLSLM